MILRAFLAKSNGESLFAKSYEESDDSSLQLPSYVKATITLFSSSSSTAYDRVYTLDENGMMWAYMFFENFAIIMLTTEKEDMAALNTRMLAIGRAIARTLGSVIQSWTGDMSEIDGLETLVTRYVSMDFDPPPKKITRLADKLVNKTLENPDVAYVGVLDASGEMMSGNLPDSILAEIEDELVTGKFGAEMDLVPSTIQIRDYKLQIFRVNSLTVVIASHADVSTMTAVRLAGEIAHSLNKALAKLGKSAK